MIFSSAAPTVIPFLQSILLGLLLSFIYDIFCSIRKLFPAQVQLHFILDILYFVLFGTILFNFLLQKSAGRLRYFIVLGVDYRVGGISQYCQYFDHSTVERLIYLVSACFAHFVQPILAIIKMIRRGLSAVQDKYSTKSKFRKISLKKALGPLYNKVSKRKSEGEIG